MYDKFSDSELLHEALIDNYCGFKKIAKEELEEVIRRVIDEEKPSSREPREAPRKQVSENTERPKVGFRWEE